MQAVSQDYIVTVATTKALGWMEFMGIPHGEVLKVVLKGEAA